MQPMSRPRYGFQLGTRPSFTGRPWADVETDVKHDWEHSNPGTWDRFREAIRHAWNRATGEGPRASKREDFAYADDSVADSSVSKEAQPQDDRELFADGSRPRPA